MYGRLHFLITTIIHAIMHVSCFNMYTYGYNYIYGIFTELYLNNYCGMGLRITSTVSRLLVSEYFSIGLRLTSQRDFI